MTIDEQIEILQAKKAGKKIERDHLRYEDTTWQPMTTGEDFNFITYRYRIAKELEVRWLWFDNEGDAASFSNSDCDDDNWDHKLKITFSAGGGKPEVEVVK